MSGRIPLIASLVAGTLGVSAAAWPEIMTHTVDRPGPSMRTALTAAFADHRWPPPRPGSWRPPRPGAAGLPPVIRQITTRDKVVFLTIDDGWTRDPRFVEIVRRQRIPIMTFLTDQAARGGYEYFWALKQAGSPIEDHTISHPDMALLPLAEQRRQICATADSIERRYGRRPRLFRPPFGAYNQLTLRAARDCGIGALVTWTAEFYNGTRSPAGRYDAFIRADGAAGFRPGDIILMHFRPGAGRDLARILGWIRGQGFRPAPLQDYLPAALGGDPPNPAAKSGSRH
ncbi:MAG TPA: polysaccharide deacetylase family protein [Streptosporangiaceae bacterium]